MSVDELYEGYWRVKKAFYSLTKILTRLPANYRTLVLVAIANWGLKSGLRAEKELIDKRSLDVLAFETAG